MEKLKHCPFCGGEVRIYYSSITKRFFVNHINKEQKCWVLMPLMISEAVSLADATDKWNRRAKDD